MRLRRFVDILLMKFIGIVMVIGAGGLIFTPLLSIDVILAMPLPMRIIVMALGFGAIVGGFLLMLFGFLTILFGGSVE